MVPGDEQIEGILARVGRRALDEDALEPALTRSPLPDVAPLEKGE
jgi:hypothetical protein